MEREREGRDRKRGWKERWIGYDDSCGFVSFMFMCRKVLGAAASENPPPRENKTKQQ